ncbi:hypothetical protein VE03_05560 [Pseudogymnoascus sp. 23342-1-I1]|nr:hypothetical protein VE03_05560 [Pseudogymnoascus sp. 23342-1-I1]
MGSISSPAPKPALMTSSPPPPSDTAGPVLETIRTGSGHAKQVRETLRTFNEQIERLPAAPQTTGFSNHATQMHDMLPHLEKRIEELALWVFEMREETRMGFSGAEKKIVAELEAQGRRLEEAIDKRQEEALDKRVEERRRRQGEMDENGGRIAFR